MLIRLVIGLLMTAIVLAFAAKRIVWLTNLIRSGQSTSDEHGRKDHLGTRITTQIKEVFGQTRLLRWSIPGIAHFFTMWGFFILRVGLPRGVRPAVRPRLPIPFIGHWDGLGFLQDFFAVAVLAWHRHVRGHSAAVRTQGARTGVPVLRIAYRRRLAHPVHDLQRHLDVCAGPWLSGEHQQPALRQRRILLAAHGRGPAPARPHQQRVDRDDRAAAAHRRDAGVPTDRAALQAPAHRRWRRST